MSSRKRFAYDFCDGNNSSDYKPSETEEALSSDWEPTARPCKRAPQEARWSTAAGGNTTADISSHPSLGMMTLQQQQQQTGTTGGNQLIRKDFTNLRAFFNQSSRNVYQLHMVRGVETVFPQLPVTVNISFVVDGQPMTNTDPADRELHKDSKASIRKASGKMIYLFVSSSCGAHLYARHQVTGYTAESGHDAIAPRLTLHLKSPAVLQAEAAALREEEEETGWITYEYQQARCRPRSLNACAAQVCFTQDFLDRAFPGVDHQGMNLQVTVIKDNKKVENADSESKVTCWRNKQNYTKAKINISAAAVHALTGCCLQLLKAKPPNLLQVITATASSSQQVTPVEQSVHNASPTTDAVAGAATAAAAAATPLSVAVTSGASSIPPTQAMTSAAAAVTAAPGPEPLAVTAAADLQMLSMPLTASQPKAQAQAAAAIGGGGATAVVSLAAAAATTAAHMPPSRMPLPRSCRPEMGFLNTQHTSDLNPLAADIFSSMTAIQQPGPADPRLLCQLSPDEMDRWCQQQHSHGQWLPGISTGCTARPDSIIMSTPPASLHFANNTPHDMRPLATAAASIPGHTSRLAAAAPTPAAIDTTERRTKTAAGLVPAAVTTAATTATAPHGAAAAVCPSSTVPAHVAPAGGTRAAVARLAPTAVTATTTAAAMTSVAAPTTTRPVSMAHAQPDGLLQLPVLPGLPVAASPLVQTPLQLQPPNFQQSVQPINTAIKADIPVIVIDSDSDDDEQQVGVPYSTNRQLLVVRVKPEQQDDRSPGLQRSQDQSLQSHRTHVKTEYCTAGKDIDSTACIAGTAVNSIAGTAPGPPLASISTFTPLQTPPAAVADSVTEKSAANAAVVQQDSKPCLVVPELAPVGPTPPVELTARSSKNTACRPFTAATLAAVNPAAVQSPGVPATAAATITAQDNQRLPAGFALNNCGRNILVAGEQLTALLDLLQAPDDQMMQLNGCINKFRDPPADTASLAGFWYDYSQLQSWVARGKVEQCKTALKQLLGNADK